MLLMLAGRWRPIGSRWWRSRRKRPAVAAMNVVRLPVADYRAPRWWERLAAVTGLGVITAVLGAIVATLIAVFLIFSVTTLTGLLK